MYDFQLLMSSGTTNNYKALRVGMDAHVIQTPVNKIKGQTGIKNPGSKWHLTHPPGNQNQPTVSPEPTYGKDSYPTPSTSCSVENGIVTNGSPMGKKYKNKRFYSFTLRSSHIVYRKQKKLFKCDVCQLHYRHVFSLKRHFLRNHVSIRYVSESDINNCKINVKNKLDKITNSDSDEKSSASSTSSTVATKEISSDVTSDKQNATMPGLFRCHLCKNLNFDTLPEIQTHFKTHLNSSDHRFPCEKCNVIFSSKPALYRHLASHSETSSFPCTTCGKIFDSKSSYLKHAATHTDNRTCKYCKKVLSTKANRSRHERIHEGLKPYQCKHCTFQFSQSGDLKKHVKEEHASLYIACDICSSLFSSKTALNKHMVDKHGKLNASKSVVQSPLQVNAKPPVQPVSTPKAGCSQGSSEKKPLETDKDNEKEQKIYNCTVCEKPYRTYMSMMQHKRQKHQKVHKRNYYKKKSTRTKQYPKASNSKKRLISEEEFYRTLPNAIANNLCNYVDGRTSHLSLTQYNFSEPMENCTVRPSQHWSTYNFPNNFDVEHALHLKGREIRNHVSETNASFCDSPAVNEFNFCYGSDSTDYAYFDLEPTDSDLSIFPEGVYIDYKNINVEERKKLVGKVIKSVIMCCVCREKLPSYQAFEDHSSNNHPNVLCTYVEIEGDKDITPIIPEDMQRTFLSPAGVYFEYDVPPPVSEARVISCTKCHVTFSSGPELHQHIISCGGKEVTTLHVRKAITQRKIKRTMKKRMNISCFKMSLYKRNESSAETTPVSIIKHSEVRKENRKSLKSNNQLNVKASVGRPKSNSCVLCPHCKQSFRTKTLLNSHIKRCYKRVVMKNESFKRVQKKPGLSKPEVIGNSEISEPTSSTVNEALQESQVEKVSVPIQDNQIRIPSPIIESSVERLSPSLEVLVNSIKEKLTADELSPSNPTFSWMEDEHFIVAPNTSQPSLVANTSTNLHMKDPNTNSVVPQVDKPISVTSAVNSIGVIDNISGALAVDSLSEARAINNTEKNNYTDTTNKADIEDQETQMKSDVPMNQVSGVCDSREMKIHASSSISINGIKPRAVKSKIKSNPYVKRRKRKSKIMKVTEIMRENSSKTEISIESSTTVSHSRNDKIPSTRTLNTEITALEQIYRTQSTQALSGNSLVPDSPVSNSAAEPPVHREPLLPSTSARVSRKMPLPSTRASASTPRELPQLSSRAASAAATTSKESPLLLSARAAATSSIESPLLPMRAAATTGESLLSVNAISRELPLSSVSVASGESTLLSSSAAVPKELFPATNASVAPKEVSLPSVSAVTPPQELASPSVSAAVAPRELVVPPTSACASRDLTVPSTTAGASKDLTVPSISSASRKLSLTSTSATCRNSEAMHSRFMEKKVQEHSDAAKNGQKEKHKCPYCMIDFTYLSTFHNHIAMCQEKHIKKDQDESQQRNSTRMPPKKDLIEESMLSLWRHQSRQSKMMKEAKTDDSSDVKNFQTYTCDNCHKIFFSLFKLLQHRVEHKLQNSDEPSASLSNTSTNNGYNTNHPLNQTVAMPMLEISTFSSVTYADSPGPSSAPSYLPLSQLAAESQHYASSGPLSVKIPKSSSTLRISGPSSAPVRLQNPKLSFSTAPSQIPRSSSVGSQLEHPKLSSSSSAKLDIPIKSSLEHSSSSTTTETSNILEKCEKQSAQEPISRKLDFVLNKTSGDHSSISVLGQKKSQGVSTPLPKKRKKSKKLIVRKHAQMNKKQIKSDEKKKGKSSLLVNREIPHVTNLQTSDIMDKVESASLASSSEGITVSEVTPFLQKTLMKSKKSTSNCESNNSCPLCGKVFSSLNYKKRHMVMKHNDPSPKVQNVKPHVNKVKTVAKKKIFKKKHKRSVLKRECKKQVLPKRSIVKKHLLPIRQRK